MEHIIQFGINIDDEKIMKESVDIAARAMAKDIEKKFFESERWTKPQVEVLFIARVNGWLEENAEEIKNRAVEELVTKLSRTKAVKEAVVDAINS